MANDLLARLSDLKGLSDPEGLFLFESSLI
jgi:hypothetical protein